jgi:hypothetical protein
MTELEEAELTDGQGRALSAHRTKESYEGVREAKLNARALCDSHALCARTCERFRNRTSE